MVRLLLLPGLKFMLVLFVRAARRGATVITVIHTPEIEFSDESNCFRKFNKINDINCVCSC